MTTRWGKDAAVFLMISTYLVPLDEVDRRLAEHLAFLDRLEARGLLLAAGRRVPADGGMVLLDVDDAARAAEVMADDPFLTNGLAEWKATELNPSRTVLRGAIPAEAARRGRGRQLRRRRVGDAGGGK